MNIHYTKQMVRWRLKETMDDGGVTRYALQKETGVAMNTIRGMYDGNTLRPDLEVLDRVLAGLRVLLKRSVGLADVLEYREGTATDGTAAR